MRLVLCGVICGWWFLGIWCAPARGDGGTVRWTGKKDGYRITVFTAPTPFRAGPVDISVLVQDAQTGEPLPQARVTVRMSKLDDQELEYPATTEAATNKLLHAAQFDLPEAGRWDLQVQVEGSQGLAVLGGEMEAAEPLPRWLELWPWFSWPGLAIVLFGVHQVLARRNCVGRAARVSCRNGRALLMEMQTVPRERSGNKGSRPECVVKAAAAEEHVAQAGGTDTNADAAKKRNYVFRGDDNYRGGPVGRALGVEADGADIQNFADHVLRKESNRTSRYSSFTEEVTVARKFTSASDNRYVSKADMTSLRELEAQGVIRIWDPDQVHVVLREGPRKLAMQASDVRAAMRRNSEILVEGQIPAGILERTK